MPSETYRLRVVRGGIEFEAEGDKKFVLDMWDRVGGSAPSSSSATAARVGKDDESRSSNNPAAAKAMSVREFIQKVGVNKHTDLAVAFGYYLEKHQGLDAFTPADVNNCYYEAKMENSNTSTMLIRNIGRGFVMEDKNADKKGRKRYTLTSSGEQFVEAKFRSTD